jgi:hypothetical protein
MSELAVAFFPPTQKSADFSVQMKSVIIIRCKIVIKMLMIKIIKLFCVAFWKWETELKFKNGIVIIKDEL